MKIEIEIDLANEILDQLGELRCERDWWRDEPRCTYQKDYEALCGQIEALEKLLGRGPIPPLEK